MHHRKFRTVIVGAGGIAKAHLRAIQENSDQFELCGVFDVDSTKAETFCKEAGMEYVAGSIEELLEKQKPDLVQICTPPAFHVDLSIQAMQAGAHVWCEKPMCGSLVDLQRISVVEAQTGKWCASVFQMRYGSGTKHLQNLIQKEFLGRPLLCVCHTLWYRGHDYYKVAWRGNWKNELGGPTVGHGIHAMDQLLSIMGDWSEVRADMGTLDRDIEVEDVSMAMIRFANGAMGSIINSLLSPREETYLRMDFQKATIELHHLYSYSNENWTFTPAPGTNDAFSETLRSIPDKNMISHGTQLRMIAEDLRSKRKPQTSGKSAEAIIDLLSAIYKSALTEKPVRRGTIVPGDPFYKAFHGDLPVYNRQMPTRNKASC